MNIKVIDAMCGEGKTSWAIQYMNNNTDKKFIFVTPFLSEVDRVIEKCKFETPLDDKVKKIDDFKRLIDEDKSIVTTHKLLSHLTVEMVEMIKNSNYTLILDEVIEAVSESQLNDNDKKALMKLGLLKEINGNLFRGDEDVIASFDEGRWAYSHIVTGLKRKNLEIFEGKILMWLFPIDILSCFNDIYILTFLFDGYPLSSYLKFHNISYTKYSVKLQSEDVYEVIDYENSNVKKYKDLITIFEDEKINSIGNDSTSFSDYWWKNTAKKNADILLELRKNIENIVKNRVKCKLDDVLWTVFKDYEAFVYNTRTKDRNFITHNIRATNDYQDKFLCIYLVSRNYNPIIKRWFKSKGIEVNNDVFAVGELIQWVFRSRVRKGESIFLYIPSSRMRKLFTKWLNGLDI